MAEPLVPHVDIRLDLLPFGKHSGADIIYLEDKHPLLLAPVHNNSTCFFDEAPEMSELDFHDLVDNLFD